MADSDKNNTQHGGVDRKAEESTVAPNPIETRYTGPNRQSEDLIRQTDNLQNRLYSPTIQESGYNTDASPATTTSSHGTPGQHFNFDNLLEPERTEQRQRRPNLTIQITKDDEDLHSLPNVADPFYSLDQRKNEKEQCHTTSKNAPANLLDISGSVTLSRSFDDLHLHGIGGSDEETETDKDDEFTSSEERYNQESFRNKRRLSLRRRNFGFDIDHETGMDDNLEKYPTENSLPSSLYNFARLDSHESHSDQNSPPTSSSLPECISYALSQFLDNNTMSSIGTADEFGETAEENDDSNVPNEEHLQCSHEFEPQVFRISISSDEEEFGNNRCIDNDDDSVFTFDNVDNISNTGTTDNSHASAPWSTSVSRNSQQPSQGNLRHSPFSSPNIVTDKPPISPSSTSSCVGHRRRRQSSSCCVRLQLSGGACFSHLEMSRSFSVGTQTPHVASVLIQDVLNTPVAMPNEARGTAVSRLRRLSESGAPLPPSPAPLPDIIPFVRDRSLSAPDFQAMTRRRAIQTGRLVGRELRQMSDEFNSSRRNSFSSNSDIEQRSASFPGMRPLLNFMQTAFGSRRGSSVDLEDADFNEDS